MTPRKRRAIADGARCPCSHDRTVGIPTPRKVANSAWLRPSEFRIERI